MIIAIDLDNVVVNTSETMLDYINKRLPFAELTIEDIKTYSIEDALPREYRWIVENGFRDGRNFWKNIKLIDGAAKYIKKLYDDGHEIYFATSSLPENIYKKIKHLCRSLDIEESYIIKHTINIQYKQLLNVDILIDDSLMNLVGKRNYYSICFDYPWNRTLGGIPYDNSYKFKRAYSWEDVYKIIEEVQNEVN